jgi:hypothetical protein
MDRPQCDTLVQWLLILVPEDDTPTANQSLRQLFLAAAGAPAEGGLHIAHVSEHIDPTSLLSAVRKAHAVGAPSCAIVGSQLKLLL